jgi:hypothetical protein
VARTVGAISASVIVLPFVGGTAEAATYPKPSVRLPSALDVVTPYQKGYRCLSETLPGVLAFAKLLNATYGKHTYGTLRSCGGEHGEGRALDWMLDASKPDQLALGNALTRWLSAKDSKGRPGAMARRLGINYIIWNRQQWYAWDPGMSWKPYYGSSPHTDHIHFSFTWDGAYERTSWWTGRALTSYTSGPPPSSSSGSPASPTTDLSAYRSTTLRRGSSGSAVKVLQKALGGLTVDGVFGPLTEARVKAYQKSKGLTQNGVVDAKVWDALGAKSDPTEKYWDVVLKRGSTGTAVKVLQKAIGELTVDGVFGPLTEARVKAYQKSKGLTQNGVVGTETWKAVAAG